MGVDLALLRGEYPAYRIWEESILGRTRYVARAQVSGVNPHTVVTADLVELRQALEPARNVTLAALSPAKPNIARMYDHWLGGKDADAADRSAADAISQGFPEVAEVARANRVFLARAVRYVTGQGITQFLDLGSGLPTSPNVHELAREQAPGARVVYVDWDPIVLAHARARLVVDDRVRVVGGDIADPRSLLADPALAAGIDSSERVCVLLLSVLHFLAAPEADAAVAALREWMAPGSYLVISAGTSTGTDPELIRRLQDSYGDTTAVTGRTAAEIAAWFDGFSLAPPGLVDVRKWRPEHTRWRAASRARFLAGVGRKIDGKPCWQV